MVHPHLVNVIIGLFLAIEVQPKHMSGEVGRFDADVVHVKFNFVLVAIIILDAAFSFSVYGESVT